MILFQPALRQTLITLLLFAAPVFGLNPTGDQWIELPKFEGGINTQFDRSSIPEGQLVTATNFIWIDGQLTGREGFYRFASPLTARPVEFMDIFKSSLGAKYLMYSDGVKLWYRSSLTQASVELEFGRSNIGAVDTWTTYVSGDAPTTQKWRTLFGSGEGLTVTVDGTNYTIDKIILDTLLWTTATTGTLTDKTYNIDQSAITVQDCLVMADNYWIYTNSGKSYFNNPDSFVIVDSLTGLRFTETTISRSFNPYPVLQWNATGVADNYSGRFLRMTSNPKTTGGTSNPITPGTSFFYMSYPIWSSGSNKVFTLGSAFQPDSTTDNYFCIDQLVYDSTTKFTRTMDSIRIFATDSTTFSSTSNGGEFCALYLKMWCDTCFFETDTTAFITGDWFMVPRTAWGDGQFTYTGTEDVPTITTDVFPVIGGFIGEDSALYVACPPTVSRDEWNIAGNGKSVAFYRMKKDISGQRSGGYDFAVLHNNRVFECRSDEPDRLYWSEPFLPDSFLDLSVVVVDQANPCMVAAKQWSDLVVYTTAGSWRIIADATAENYGKEQLNTSRGCVARGSFLNIDNVHYGLAADGFWECDGNEPLLISNDVSSYFTDTLNQAEFDEVRSGYDAENDNIWISFPRVGATKNSITLVYHRGTKSWWRQSFVAGSYAYNPDLAVSDSVRFLAGGIDSSTIYVRGGRTDDGVSITASLQMPYMNFGDPIAAKRLKSLMLIYDSEVAAAVSVFGYRDYGLTAFDTVTFTSAAVWSQKWLRVPDARYFGNNLAVGLSIANAARMKFAHMRLQVMGRGETD